MLNKIRKQKKRHILTLSDRLPNLRSRQFIINFLQLRRAMRPSPGIRAAIGCFRGFIIKFFFKESRVKYKTYCFLSARTRGVIRRFSLARTKIKRFSDSGKLFGVRKSS